MSDPIAQSGPDGSPRAVAAHRFTYYADDALGAALLLRLAEMLAFDHGERMTVEAAALPYTVVHRSGLAMMPVDRRAVGFAERPGSTGATPTGLTRRSDEPHLTPADGPMGASWRTLLNRWNARPALAPVLGEHGLPTALTDPDTGRLCVPRIVVAETSELSAEHASAPVLLRYQVAPPDITHLLPADHDDFDRLATTVRQVAMRGLAR